MEFDFKRILEFSTEELIDFIHFHNIEKLFFLDKINSDEFEELRKHELINTLQVAYERIQKPLSFSDKLLYLFFPFGYISRFYTYDSDLKKFREFRFIKKIRQYWIYSIIGLLGYTMIAVILGAFKSF